MAQISKKSPTPETLSEDAKVPSFGDVLKNRNFRYLWLGQIFSQLPDKVFIVLVIALIDAHFKEIGGASMVSAFYVTHSMPAILFGSIAGVFVDRWSKKNVLVFSNVLRGILVLLLPLLPDSFGYMLLITFLVSTLTQFFAPAETSVIPLILQRKYLLIANSLFTATMSGSIFFLGLGDPALALVGGARNGHWLVGGAYLLSSLILSLVRTGEGSNQAEEQTSLWADLKEGLDYVRGNKIVQTALIQLLVLYSLLASLNILAFKLTDKLSLRHTQFGFLLTATAVGFAIGTWGLSRYGQQFARSRLAATGSLVIALALGLIAFVSNLWGVLALCVLMGSAVALVMAPMQTAIQEETPEDLRGKVFGLQNNVVNIATTVPLGLTGLAVDSFGLQPVILGLSAVSLGAAFISQKTRPSKSN